HPDPYSVAAQAGVLRAGEASGIQDAVGGFGIRYAVGSGALAAKSLLTGSDYAAMLREEFSDDFEVAMKSRAWRGRATDQDFDGRFRGWSRMRRRPPTTGFVAHRHPSRGKRGLPLCGRSTWPRRSCASCSPREEFRSPNPMPTHFCAAHGMISNRARGFVPE